MKGELCFMLTGKTEDNKEFTSLFPANNFLAKDGTEYRITTCDIWSPLSILEKVEFLNDNREIIAGRILDPPLLIKDVQEIVIRRV